MKYAPFSLLIALSLSHGCGSEDPADTSAPVDDTGTVAPADSATPQDTSAPTPDIVQLQTGLIGVGTEFTLSDVVVTAVAVNSAGAGFGLFVQDPAGGPHSGIWVYMSEGADAFSVGDTVDITGIYEEYDANGSWSDTVSELNLWDPQTNARLGSISKTSSGPAPSPVVLTSAEAMTEAYEGVLVQIDALTVSSSLDDVGVFVSTDDSGDLPIRDRLTPSPAVYVGDTFTSVTGVVDFNKDRFKLLARDPADFAGHVSAITSLDAASPGDVIFTEFMANPDAGGACSDANGEYIELLNVSDTDYGLEGSVLTYAGTKTAVIGGGVTLAAGERIVASRKNPSPCYQHASAFTFSFSLTNGGAVLSLSSPNGSEIDAVDFSQMSISAGQSLELSSDREGSTGNSSANWCTATSDIAMATGMGTPDQGTPGSKGAVCP